MSRDWSAINLKRRYGITLAEYDQMFEDQNGKCAICGTTEPGGRNGRFHVDHNHVTGVVRGLLCHHCNTALGKFGDDEATLQRAIDYLRERGSYGSE